MCNKHRLRLCCILGVLQLFWCLVLQHPYRMGATLTILNAVAGAAAIYINWDSDHLRQVPVRGILASATCVHCGDKVHVDPATPISETGSQTRRTVAADIPGNGR